MSAPTQLAQRFELRGTLGAGGAGVVYRAFDHQLGREVALKLLRQASGRDLFRFKREFRALADIAHPNLIALHELHATGGEWFFTMELVEGVSFIDWVRPGAAAGPSRTRADIAAGRLVEGRLRAALIQLADALMALHQAGKLHRDLKPSNVLVTEGGRVALLDFGLVASVAEDNPERLAVGTPVYMSPEQASDQPLGEASDWYAVGAMAYEALTGRRPFEGASEEVMKRKQRELPPPPDGAPDDLARLCMHLLEPAPTARPTGAELLAALGAGPSAPTRDLARSLAPPVFVGRSRELDELARALAEARATGAALLVGGPSGIGKTALVRQFLRRQGGAVFALEGRCFEREQVPFKMLDGVVDALTQAIVALPPAEQAAAVPRDAAALVRLFPVTRRVPPLAEAAGGPMPALDPVELRRRGFHALRDVLARLGCTRPVVAFVDDAQWGDADSAAFLAELVHRPEPGVLVVLAHRPEDYLGIVAKLARGAASSGARAELRRIDLTRLAKADAHGLVTPLVADEARATAIVERAGGNPLVLVELARAPELAPGARIEELVRARVTKLPLEAQAMLAVTSIAARPIPVAIAACAAGIVGGRDEAAQLGAARLGTLRQVDGEAILLPAHEHVRRAVLAGLDVESTALWHEAIARAYEDVQGEGRLDSEAVVEHWLAAGHPGNAAHHAVAAAARAESALAFRRAAELYEIARVWGPWDAVGQRDLLRKQAHALACAGLLDDAAAVLEHAAQLLVDDEAIDCERLRIEALLRRGRLDDALPAAERLLDQIGVRAPLGRRLAALWRPSRLRGFDFTPRGATEVRPAELARIDVLYSIASGLAFAAPQLGRAPQGELVRAALECGEPVRVCLALAQEVWYAAAAGSRSWSAVAAVGERLREVARDTARPAMLGLADASVGIAAHLAGRWAEAQGALERGLAALRDHAAGMRWELDLAEGYWLATLAYRGEWRGLIRHAQQLLRDALERGDVVAQLAIRTGGAALAHLAADRIDHARAELAAAEASLPGRFHAPHARAVLVACHVEIYAGDAAAAARRLDAAWPELERTDALRVQQLHVELLVARAAAVLGDASRPAAERGKQARALADDVIKEGAPWSVGLGLLVRAGALAARGDPDGARAALLAAEEQLAQADMPGHLEAARWRRGALDGGTDGASRTAAAAAALAELGAANPAAMAGLLAPWPR